jgi:tRNA modification GTPase
MNDKHNYSDGAIIAALATAPAVSALAIIRLSGSGSLEALAKIFSRPQALHDAPGNTIVYGWILDGAMRVDEVLISVYRSPKSYTGEEGADISCHGGNSAVMAVMKQLFNAGFREALPGEFTFRAFINGKLDLTKAESVMEIVGAKNSMALSHAAGRLSGVLQTEIDRIKSLIVRSLAETELNLDYSEIDGIDGEGLPARDFIEDALLSLKKLVQNYSYEKLFRQGALVVLAGKPNAGKSSLFNLLVKEDRSIVSDIPGTTRDWIENWISLDGIPLRLVDTAGLHNSDNMVEKIGIERSKEFLQSADLVVYMIAADNPQIKNEMSEIKKLLMEQDYKIIFVWNKSDIAMPPCADFLPVSAKTGDGVSSLCSKITESLEKIYKKSESTSLGIGSERQKKLIDIAIEDLQSVIAMQDAPLDIIAPLLREAADSLGTITGEVSTDDILETMFSQFCVGK